MTGVEFRLGVKVESFFLTQTNIIRGYYLPRSGLV